jgi:hypothetical protein
MVLSKNAVAGVTVLTVGGGWMGAGVEDRLIVRYRAMVLPGTGLVSEIWLKSYIAVMLYLPTGYRLFSVFQIGPVEYTDAGMTIESEVIVPDILVSVV